MIARKSALIVSANFVAGVLNYIGLYVIAKYYTFPKFAIGLVSFSFAFVALFNMIPNLGFDTAHIKRISEGKDLSMCNGIFVSIRFLLTILMIFIVFISLFLWKYVLGGGFEDPFQEKAVYIMLTYFVLLSLARIFTITNQARKEVALSQLPFFVEAIVRTIAIAYFAIYSYGPLWIVYAYVIGGFALFLSAYYFFRYPVGKPSKEYASLYLKFALPLSVVAISGILMINIDKVMIQRFWGYEQGADYFSVYGISSAINSITMAFGILLLPTMSALYAAKRTDDMKKLSMKAERYISLFLMPIVFLSVFLAKPLIAIALTEKFYSAIPILQTLPFYALFDALERPYQTKLLGMNQPNFARNRIILMVCVNIVLNSLLIPREIKSLGLNLFGLAGLGAAIATVVAYFIALIYTRLITYRLSKIGLNSHIFLHAFAALSMGLIITFLLRFYVIDRWYELMAISIIGLLLYVGILTLIREFKKEDFKLLFDTFNPLKMLSYIREEFKRN